MAYTTTGRVSGSTSIGTEYNPTLPELQTLASGMNAINRLGQSEALAARIPGASDLEAQSSQMIASELRGEVPQDVLAQLGREGAEGAVGTGTASQAAYLRALGLTSLQLQQTGQSNLSAALARNPAAPLYDPSTQLITPAQQAQLDLSQQQQNLAAQREKAQEDLAAAQLSIQAQQNALRGRAGTSYNLGGMGGGGTSTITEPGMVVAGGTGGGGVGTIYQRPDGSLQQVNAFGQLVTIPSPVSASQAVADQTGYEYYLPGMDTGVGEEYFSGGEYYLPGMDYGLSDADFDLGYY